jgi:hypothetical protein
MQVRNEAVTGAAGSANKNLVVGSAGIFECYDSGVSLMANTKQVTNLSYH